MRRGAKPAKAKVEAKLPAARKSRKDEGAKVRDLETRLAKALKREAVALGQLQTRSRELAESQEQQTATSEILRVIGSSPTDVQPVFDTIVSNAVRLCDGLFSALFRFDGEQLHTVALHNISPEALEILRRTFPMRPSRSLPVGRAILDCAVAHVPDVERDPEYRHLDLVARGGAVVQRAHLAHAVGWRSALAAPLLREGSPIGVIFVARAEAGSFSNGQIALLQTFAAQAVIAIENVRLFKELQEKNQALTQAHAQVSEALEQQTATAEILRLIAASPTDLESVLGTVAETAMRVCGARDAVIFRCDGDVLRLACTRGPLPVSPSSLALPLNEKTATGRSVVERRTIHVHDLAAVAASEYPEALSRGVLSGSRTVLATPLLQDGEPLGAILIRRGEVQAFTDKQIALLETFADQAVIAIENVRLFKELQEKNSALTTAHGQVSEALEQQTATSEILRVISRSPTDVQPVFDAIVESAARLCDAFNAAVVSFDGELMRLEATRNWTPEAFDITRRIVPAPPSRAVSTGRAILERAVVHVPDVERDLEYLPELGRAGGFRSVLAVPMLRDGIPLGAITVGRAEPGPFSDNQIALLKTFADQAVIAIENVRLFTELQASNRELTTALDTQTATSDILRVISRSQTNVQPVFDAIVASAVRLLGAYTGALTQIAGDQIELAALTSTDDAGDAATRARFPQSLQSEGSNAQAIRDRAPINIADAQTDPRTPEAGRATARARGYRSQVVVPLLRHDEAVGTIAVSRREPGGFTDDEIALLKTFADQAVIAIENARLLSELQDKNEALAEALEQQTATGEILNVISRSPTDVQPVFDAIAQSALRLCEGHFCNVLRYDGELLHLGAHADTTPAGIDALRQVFPLPPSRATLAGRVVLDAAVTHIRDCQADPEFLPSLAAAQRLRSAVGVPILREGRVIGSIGVGRSEVRSFTNKQTALLQTFADQAVIAIENVRLFTELQQKNEALTQAHAQVSETLEQQTATSEILRVISSSPTDLQPVFDTIVESVVQLCDGVSATVYRFDGELIHLVAHHHSIRSAVREVFERVYPLPPSRKSVVAQAILDRAVIHVRDFENDPSIPSASREMARAVGHRSLVAVPMLRPEGPIGAISVGRRGPHDVARPFSENEISLLKTFADQAVIAVENVRLFKELEARTGALARSVEQLTALGEVGRAVSSSLDLETVLTTIVSRAVELSGLDGGVVFEYDESAEEFVQRAMTETDEALAEARRATRIRKGEGVLGRTAITLEPVQVADIAMPSAYEGRLRQILIDAGVRAILAVPMLREGQLIGCLGVTRNSPGEFPTETIELLRTFATQSALAIQNARLFHEIADKSHQLEVASQHKSEFLANMSHELRTPLNAIIGFSEVLTERMFGELNEKQEEYLKDIYTSGTHLLSLINDILDLSKIEAGRMELELTDFDLPQALDSALILVRERAGRRSITLQATIDQRLGEVRADERKIRQVVLNLLSNAIKFTPEGGRIEVGAVPRDGFVEVSVSDTGVGIAPEDQEAVFEEFRQVGTAEKKAEGTGLGLTLCRKFVELHGGRIWVKSQVGVGSTFTFRLPVRCGE